MPAAWSTCRRGCTHTTGHSLSPSAPEHRAALQEEPLVPTGNAIIVFNEESAAKRMLADFKSAEMAAVGALISPNFARGLHIMTGAQSAQPPSLPCAPAEWAALGALHRCAARQVGTSAC